MFEITIEDADFLSGLEIGEMETAIYSDARSSPGPSGRGGGYPYFWPVDRGRGPVVATQAKALRFVINGHVIFRKSVGPAAARNITDRSLSQLDQSCLNAAFMTGQIGYGTSVRNWIAGFLSKLAYFHSQVLADFTPNPGGKLASSYRPTIAV